MESLVLCPEELCLGPAAARVPVGVDTSAEFSIWTNEAAEKGARFLPWKGTVRSDKLAVYNKLPEFDVSGGEMISSLHIYTKIQPLSRDVLFSVRSSGYQMGC